MFIAKIISGGQTGADTGGLRAALALGITTGGYAPKGYKTESGNNNHLALLGLVETESPSYTVRTELNVIFSDGTVLFGDMRSPGSKQTMLLCQRKKKPYICNPSVQEFFRWGEDNNIHILNVAGNRESRSKGLEEKVFRFLSQAIAVGGLTLTLPPPQCPQCLDPTKVKPKSSKKYTYTCDRCGLDF